MSETPQVRPGQVWADNDPRSAGRTLRVDEVSAVKVTVTILTNYDEVQEHLDSCTTPGHKHMSDRRGKQTAISLIRFKPTSSGYRLIKEA